MQGKQRSRVSRGCLEVTQRLPYDIAIEKLSLLYMITKEKNKTKIANTVKKILETFESKLNWLGV